ncbi:hypothetical protein GW17_00032965 [Ensete ventricosum]|nr:hypothetical protein GW17_00032965 [Ensete ventricosum]
MRSDPFLHKLELDESLEPAIDDPADEPLYVPDDSLAEIDCYVNPLDEALLREIVSTDEAAGGARHLIDEITVLPAVPRRRRGQTQRRPRRQLESLLVPVPLSRGSCARAYIVGIVDHPYLATRLPLWLTLSSYASTMPVVFAVRDASTSRGIGLTCVRSAVRPLGYRSDLCQVGRTTAGDSALPVLGQPHDHWRPHTCVQPASCIGSATSAGQLSEGAMMWRSDHYVSYHSPPGEDLLDVPNEGAEDEVLCLVAGSRWP